MTQFTRNVHENARSYIESKQKLPALPLLVTHQPAYCYNCGANPSTLHPSAADARTQTLLQAEVAWNMGLIDSAQKETAERMQLEIVQLMDDLEWRKARHLADKLMAYITACSGLATLEDVRR